MIAVVSSTDTRAPDVPRSCSLDTALHHIPTPVTCSTAHCQVTLFLTMVTCLPSTNLLHEACNPAGSHMATGQPMSETAPGICYPGSACCAHVLHAAPHRCC
eukprot:GHRQ01005063.1.p3 GENE.GHRQ01005063.1~~GHRQ01005063.1.p3  ORF type:complete len:102 (-),score=9.83 GHRQ01005063.1:162-467(-)